jgi:hypothetical protein
MATTQPPPDAEKKIRHQRTFLRLRIPIVRQEINMLAEEHKTLASKTKELESIPSDERIAIIARTIYTAERRRRAVAELQSLMAERKAIGAKA